ncbi:uncharacterized protein LOC129761208 [Toxorhynchites rutilus septentrionalis]|uniref:uncharacterized protein LOC129761208 n=1 Tax=Toxorhynchites rutilus septentrionalis TaxID=329112 RepID=UPI0024790EA3|nr:uncharacterized protein LOC129761208 [Toxorhynchites rutilus septentrionalis]
MQSMMKEGGFQLRKWSSSHREVLRDLPPELIENATKLNLEPENHIKTLGIIWETESDQLGIDVKATLNHDPWTKRKIFSAIAQLYDPLGIISPVIMWAKIRMQHLWAAALGWEDPIQDTVGASWNEFYEQLPFLKEFRVSRFLFTTPRSSIQFHVFSDTSEAGYGACIYARSTSKEGTTKIEIIASKSRVAPIKRLSLPRLELCAALLGAKLYARVSAALRMEGNPCWFWSDSTVTLHWIKSPPNTWQTFVGNRTSEIQSLTHGRYWNHVKGSDNPADYVSRGMLPADFLVIKSWRFGPDWLTMEENDWPKHDDTNPPSEEDLERRKTVAVVQTSIEIFFLFHRYSSFTNLVRITAFVLRFCRLYRRKKSQLKLQEFLTVHELKVAKETLVKCAQQEQFADELKTLKTNNMVSLKSSIKLLHPFLDENGIIRVGGRLQRSNETYITKHPMIIPNNHPPSRLIAVYFHALCLHSGPRMTLATIRREFWPINGTKLANNVCRKCPKCFRISQTPITQPVGQLPKTRTIPSRPFSITGVDYCGPIYLKPTHRRAASRKAYIAVFVCFSTKAVHLELVCDLTTEAFIAALRRFVARRGLPMEVHSDNGTNFVGAKNILNELYNTMNSKKHLDTVTHECSSRGITWNFIPPRTPNFGGLWEAAVKTAKTSLTKTIGTTQLSFEDFSTVLTQIEANMNSRPLTPLSEDPGEYDVLTPSHFLIGTPLNSMPDPDYSHTPINRLRHYQQLQKLIQDHWIRWRKEYLSELNNQRKRTSLPIDIRVGQMILVQDENKPSIAWPLGRIESTHPGEDGVVRVVTIKTANGSYKRPVSKIFPLPFDRDVTTAHSELMNEKNMKQTL